MIAHPTHLKKNWRFLSEQISGKSFTIWKAFRKLKHPVIPLCSNVVSPKLQLNNPTLNTVCSVYNRLEGGGFMLILCTNVSHKSITLKIILSSNSYTEFGSTYAHEH